MAKAKQARKPEVSPVTGQVEEKVLAFAKQLGVLIGTVQGKAEGWLDREALSKEVSRIRDGAAELLAHVSPTGKAQPKKSAKSKAAAKPGRGPVDAPGKRHRKPAANEPIGKHLGEARGRQMGQKTVKNARRSGGR